MRGKKQAEEFVAKFVGKYGWDTAYEAFRLEVADQPVWPRWNQRKLRLIEAEFFRVRGGGGHR